MTRADNIIANMVEVLPSSANGFSKIVETLTRMGVQSKTDKVLSQTAHILHKQGKYYIAHFKEMMLLDGKTVDITEGDIARRNRIVQMLNDWGLCNVVDHSKLDPLGHPNIVKVVKFSEKDQWVLVPKYTIGVKKS